MLVKGLERDAWNYRNRFLGSGIAFLMGRNLIPVPQEAIMEETGGKERVPVILLVKRESWSPFDLPLIPLN